MLDPIVARARTVAQLLSDDYRLALPYFQRGYAWQEQHVARLLADLNERADGGGDIEWYPLGTMLLAKQPDLPEAWVADGHQRFITLTILIALLRDLEDDPALKRRLAQCILADAVDGEERYRLTTHEGAKDCLRAFVQEAGSTVRPYPDADIDLSESAQNIIANRDYLAEVLGKLSAERRFRLATYLLDRCFILVAAVAEQQVARLMFSTMHDTGLKPSSVDLFKAQVLGRVNIDARDECQTIWEQLAARLGQSNFDTLLRHILVLEMRTQPKETVQYALQTHFDLDEANGARSFVQRPLRTIGGHFAGMLEASLRHGTLPAAITRRVQYLEWVRNHDTWALPVLHWLDRRGADDPETVPFMRRIEALAWCSMIRTEEPAKRDQRYIAILEEIDKGSIFLADSALVVSRREQQAVRAVLTQANYARRRYRLFLLMRINAALQGDEVVEITTEATMEHIFPSKPAAGSRWLTDFPETIADRYRGMLGNLTLLTETEQNKARNYDFRVKREVLTGSRFALSRRLGDQTAWGPKQIDQATRDMIDIVMRSWGFA